MKTDAWAFNGEVELYIGHRGTEPVEKWLSVEEARKFADQLIIAADKAEKRVDDLREREK